MMRKGGRKGVKGERWQSGSMSCFENRRQKRLGRRGKRVGSRGERRMERGEQISGEQERMKNGIIVSGKGPERRSSFSMVRGKWRRF
jgi:hypothetical protein